MTQPAITQLFGLCQDAITASSKQTAEAEASASRESLERAARFARSTFGAEAANLMGPWTPSDCMPADEYSAFVQLAPRAVLLYTETEDGWKFSVLTHCGTCSAVRDTEVNDLVPLGNALRQAAVMR